MMTAIETKEMISAEFMTRYKEWFEDRINLSDREYATKYGWNKSEKLMSLKDSITAVSFFHKYIFSAFRSYEQWKLAGYDTDAIGELWREGFLSQTQRKWKSFLYISQTTAKQIYKAAKA